MAESLFDYCIRERMGHLLVEWDREKNGRLSPETVSRGSNKKVWWRCAKGHSWETAICSRTRSGTGCPICAGKQILPEVNDLASAFPHIAAEWHPEKNGSLRPDRVAPYSERRVWWLCGEGHEYETVINYRTASGSGCPVCARRGRKKKSE